MAYHLQLGDEQLAFRDTVREFVEREVKPVVLHPNHLQNFAKPLPMTLIDQAADMGLRSLMLPEELGGAGADQLTACIVAEELAAGDVGIATTLMETAQVAALLFVRMMTAEQRARWLPLFANDARGHLAFAVHTPDPDQAWAYHRARPAVSPAPVKAVREANGDWVLNGATGFVQNAPLAKWIVVQAGAADGGTKSFLVPAPSAGMRVSDSATNPNAVKWFHGAGGEVTFNHCRVPAANVLGDGAAEALAAISAGRGSPIAQAMNIGIARAALEAAVTYAKLRVQGGRTIIQHQGIANLLSDAAIKIEAARGLVWRAAWACDHPEAVIDRSPVTSDLPLQSAAKVFTSEAMYTATEQAAECFGAMGVMLDMPLAKYVNEARVFLHSGESNSIAKLRVAEAVAGFEPTTAVA